MYSFFSPFPLFGFAIFFQFIQVFFFFHSRGEVKDQKKNENENKDKQKQRTRKNIKKSIEEFFYF